MEQLLHMIAGAVLTVVGVIVKTCLDRRTYSSTRIFELRVEALNRIWQTFNEMKGLYASRIVVGFLQWQNEYAQQAGEALTAFRRATDNAQVVLPAEVIDILRKMDEAYFIYHDDDTVQGSEFQGQVKSLLDQLATAVNMTMSKQAHKINLCLRT